MDEPLSWEVKPDSMRSETQLADGNGGLVTRWVVPYKITGGPAKGTQHAVHLDHDDFTPDTVRQAIANHAANVHAIAGLSSAGS